MREKRGLIEEQEWPEICYDSRFGQGVLDISGV